MNKKDGSSSAGMNLQSDLKQNSSTAVESKSSKKDIKKVQSPQAPKPVKEGENEKKIEPQQIDVKEKNISTPVQSKARPIYKINLPHAKTLG
ncbi:hypothetical protein MXB_1587 [Myxobolus squamalis]|nr:hypothetical protein MXB_1587 [Myxobolus squamalis]